MCSLREFDVEGVKDPRQSLTQLEDKGQAAGPVWSTQLSPDSACSEGSAGSLEQPPDAGQTLVLQVLQVCCHSDLLV